MHASACAGGNWGEPGSTARHWIAQVHRPSYWWDLLCIYFPLKGLLANQPVSDECFCDSVDLCDQLCLYVCVVYMCLFVHLMGGHAQLCYWLDQIFS